MTNPNSTKQRQERDDLLDALLDAMDERRAVRASNTSAPPIQASPPLKAPSPSPPAKETRKQPPGPGEPGWTAPPELPSIGLGVPWGACCC